MVNRLLPKVYCYFCNTFKKYQQFCLFLLVGGLNTLFGYSIFSVFIFFGFRYPLAVFFATVLGVLFNFKTMGRIVFKSRDNSLIFRFFAIYGVQYCINIGLIKSFLFFSPNVYLAGAMATAICAVMSYFLNKYFVFTVRV